MTSRAPMVWDQVKMEPEEFIAKIKSDPLWEYLFLKAVIAAIMPVPLIKNMHDAGILDMDTFLHKREHFIIHYFDFKVLKPYDLETFQKMQNYFDLVNKYNDQMRNIDAKKPGDA